MGGGEGKEGVEVGGTWWVRKKKNGGQAGVEASKRMRMMDEVGTTKTVPAPFEFSHSSCWFSGLIQNTEKSHRAHS